MGRRSPAKGKNGQAKKTPVYGSASDAAMGSAVPLSASLDSNIAPRLDPVSSDEPWSPSRNALRSPTKPLAHQVTSLQQEKDIIDNKLWEMTVELQERIRQSQEDNDRMERLQNELNRLKSDKEEESHLLESLKGREDELRAALQSANSQALQDKKSFLEKLESRDGYIEGLQNQIEQLRSQVQSATRKTSISLPAEPSDLREGDNTTISMNTDTSLELNFDGSVIPQTPASSELLSSSHQKRQVMALRNKLNKRRIENLELKRQLTDLSAKAGVQWSPQPDDDSDIDIWHDESETTQSSLPDASQLEINSGFTLSDDIAEGTGSQKLPEASFEVPETLHNQARAINHALIPMAEYEKLSNQETLADSPIDLGRLKRLAAQLNLSVMSNDEYERINRLLHGDKSVKKEVESHVLQDLVRQNTIALLSPSKQPLQWAATRTAPESVRNFVKEHNLVLVPHSSSAVTELARTFGLDVVSKKDTKQLGVASKDDHSVGVGSSREEIAAAAAPLGLALIPVKQLERLQNDTKRAEQPPNAANVAELARLAGLQVIPENPTVEEVRHIASDDMVIVEREVYDALENPGPATLSRLANLHDLAILPKSEVEQLRSQRREQSEALTGEPKALSSLSEAELKTIAEKKNLVVLSAEDYQKMISNRSTRDFSNLPMAERTGFFEKLINAQNSPGSPSRQSPSSSLGSMAERIGGMGFVLVKKEEYAQLKESQKVYSPTKADIISSAKEHGLATMPIEEYTKLRSTKWSSPLKDRKLSAENSPSKGESPKLKGEEDFKAVPSTYLNALQRIVETPTSNDVQSMARKAGLNVVEAEGSADAVINRAKELGLTDPLSNEEIRKKAKQLGLVEQPTQDDYLAAGRNCGLIDPLSESDIIKHAIELGYGEKLSDEQIKTAARALGLVDPPTEEEALATARRLGLVDPVTDEEILKRALALGLTHKLSDDEIKTAAQRFGLVYPPTENEIRESAINLGFFEPSDGKIRSAARDLGLIDPLTESDILSRASDLGWAPKLSDDQIKAHARELGLTEPLGDDQICEKARLIGLVEPLSDEEILGRATQLGLVPRLSDQEVVRKALSLGLVHPPGDSDILSRAKELGMTFELPEKEILGRARSLGLSDPLSNEDIISRAEGLGMVSKLSNDEIMVAARSLGLSDPLTDEEIAGRAKELGLINQLTDHEIASKARSLGLSDPLSDDDILRRARGLGFSPRLSDDEINTQARSLGLTDPLTDEEIIAKAGELGMEAKLSDEDITSKARSLGLVNAPSNDEIRSRAKSLGMARELTNDEILDSARSLGLVDPLNDDAILTRARELGLVSKLSDGDIVLKARSMGLADPLTDDDILRRARKLGLDSPLSDKEVTIKARSLGLIDPLTDEDIVIRAQNLGMSAKLSESDIRARARSLGLTNLITDDEVVSRAKKLGLVFPLTDREILSRARSLGFVDPLDDREIPEPKNDLGTEEHSLVLHDPSIEGLSEGADKRSNAESTLPTDDKSKHSTGNVSSGRLGLPRRSGNPDNTTQSAVDKGLVSPRWTELDTQGTVSETPLSAHETNLTDQPLKSGSSFESRGAGQSAPRKSDFDKNLSRASTDVFTVSKPTDVAAAAVGPRSFSTQNKLKKITGEGKVSSSGLPKTLATTSSPQKTSRKFEVKTTPRRSNTTASQLSRQRAVEQSSADTPVSHKHEVSSFEKSVRRPSNLRTDTASSVSDSENDVLGLPLPRPLNRHEYSGRQNTGLSQTTLSSWSIRSLTADDASQYLSQLVMGEVLYKYYGGLNFEGITGGRHRRYFWFRPDRRKLFWSRENPQFFGHANPRSITVVDVNEQIDRNPLPAGLYHRTLVIKGLERDVRVTCVNQGRHYVWLATLRHIISQKGEKF